MALVEGPEAQKPPLVMFTELKRRAGQPLSITIGELEELPFGSGQKSFAPQAVMNYLPGGDSFGSSAHYTADVRHKGNWYGCNDDLITDVSSPPLVANTRAVGVLWQVVNKRNRDEPNASQCDQKASQSDQKASQLSQAPFAASQFTQASHVFAGSQSQKVPHNAQKMTYQATIKNDFQKQ